jgi:hypothetical protein
MRPVSGVEPGPWYSRPCSEPAVPFSGPRRPPPLRLPPGRGGIYSVACRRGILQSTYLACLTSSRRVSVPSFLRSSTEPTRRPLAWHAGGTADKNDVAPAWRRWLRLDRRVGSCRVTAALLARAPRGSKQIGRQILLAAEPCRRVVAGRCRLPEQEVRGPLASTCPTLSASGRMVR